MDGTQGPGTRGDTRWMTYRELGKARGISADSAARLAFRKGWPRQPGNDGAARVAVPIGEDQPSPYDARAGIGDAATGEAPGKGARGAVGRGARGVRGQLDAEFALAIATLRERADQAEKQADTERGRADREREGRERAEARADAANTDRRQADADRRATEVRAHEAEKGRDLANSLADELRGQLETARQLASAAETAAEAAQIAQSEAEADAAELRQADAARKGRGRMARLRAAWRGE
jgi:hypothetical protein